MVPWTGRVYRSWNRIKRVVTHKQMQVALFAHTYFDLECTAFCTVTSIFTYIRCFRRNLPYFWKTFLKLNNTNVTKNVCTRIWTVSQIMKRLVLKNENNCTFIEYQIHIKTTRNL
jgi:hypothetical protein